MNYNELKDLLKRYIKARIPYIEINTIEKQRTIQLIKEISQETNQQMKLHSMSKGFVNLLTNENYSTDKMMIGALDYIANELQTSQNQIYILSDVQDLDTETIISRYLLDLTNIAENRSSIIIIITAGVTWPPLLRQGMSLDLDLPNEQEIFDLVVESIRPYQSEINIEWEKKDVEEVANILLGISSIEVKNVISTLIAKGSLLKNDLIDLKFAKDSLFSNIQGLEKINVPKDLSFGGLENLKQWLDEKEKLLSPQKRQELKSKGIRPPRGILLMGVPGAGKSISSKAIALRWQRPLYRLDFATIQGKYVGQSEQQLKEAFDTAEHVSPCVLWIDEIEKGLASSNSDSSGVTQRMIGQFLFWLQECEKDVFVVATANNVSELPPELLRKGRFDELFFLDMPTKKERKEIIGLYLKKYLEYSPEDVFLNQLVELTVNYTGSDIEAIIRDLAYQSIAQEQGVSDDMIVLAFKKSVSQYSINKEKIDFIRNWAKGRTINASIIEEDKNPEALTIENI